MAKIAVLLLFTVVFNCVRGYTLWNTPNSLQPVQNLYVKPSSDGITGDLYVAASENNGMKSQWIADHPVNFLAAAQHALGLPYGSLPQDETVVTTQKRAVITSSPLQYTYAYPGTSKEGGAIPYPYTPAPVQSTATKTSEGSTDCAEKTAPVYSPYSPFHYYYPQMMSAFASAAVNALKEAGLSEDKVNSVLSQATSSVWPPTYGYPSYPSYSGYPVQYVMMDPTAWSKSLSTSEPTPATEPTTSPAITATNSKEETQ